MRKWQGWTALALIAVASAGSAPAASAGTKADFDWFGLGGCTLPVVGMPVDFHNVAPDIPPEHHARLITLGSGEHRQALLIFVLGRCPTNSLEMQWAAPASRQNVIQVMVGVLYEAGTSEDAGKAQFYLLTSAINWESFVAAEGRIGLPAYFEPNLGLSVDRDPLTGAGTFVAKVPKGAATLTASGQLVAPNPIREFDLDAAHFFQGPHGLVRVHHDESWAVGNAGQATIRTPSGSRVARWMGATEGNASGFYYWDHETRHVHRYRLIGHLQGGLSAPTIRVRCAAVRAAHKRRRIRCSVNLSHAGKLTVRVTRRGRLHAYARRSLRSGRRKIALRTRRRLVAGRYRLRATIRTAQGSSTTARTLRIRRPRRR